MNELFAFIVFMGMILLVFTSYLLIDSKPLTTTVNIGGAIMKVEYEWPMPENPVLAIQSDPTTGLQESVWITDLRIATDTCMEEDNKKICYYLMQMQKNGKH